MGSVNVGKAANWKQVLCMDQTLPRGEEQRRLQEAGEVMRLLQPRGLPQPTRGHSLWRGAQMAEPLPCGRCSRWAHSPHSRTCCPPRRLEALDLKRRPPVGPTPSWHLIRLVHPHHGSPHISSLPMQTSHHGSSLNLSIVVPVDHSPSLTRDTSFIGLTPLTPHH